MTRRCSVCNNDRHSKRTCNSTKNKNGFKLFGVRLTDPTSFIKKSASLSNLSHYSTAAAAGSSEFLPDGYHSDDPSHGSIRRRNHNRKKGTPWTEEEHRQFLVGLQTLGKGDWRGISENHVHSKTPTQVASHAQKYFIRQSEGTRRKRRSSLFDMVTDMETNTKTNANTNANAIMSSMSADIANEIIVYSSPRDMNIVNPLPSLDLSLKPVYMPSPFQLWPRVSPSSPCQIHKEPGKEILGLARLTVDDTKTALVEPPPLSLRLPGNS